MSSPIVQAYFNDGYAVLPAFYDSEDVEAARRAVGRLHERALARTEPALTECCVFERDLPPHKRGGLSIAEDQDAPFIVGDPSRFDPFFLKLFLRPTLLQVVQSILGEEDIVLHFANITTKASAIGSGISWHRDYPNKYICPVEPNMVRTMICLDGMDADNGCTQFVGGSHQDLTVLGSDISAGDGRIGSAICPPGSVVAIHPLSLHGGAPNRSSKPRRNIVIQWGVRGAPMQTSATESVTGLGLKELGALARPKA